MKVKELKELLNTFEDNEDVYVFDAQSDIYDLVTVDKLEHYQQGVHLFPGDRQLAYEQESSRQYDLFYFAKENK